MIQSPSRPESTRSAEPTPRATQRRRFSTVGMLTGTLFFAFSLTPSLVPRSVTFQGIMSGLSLTLGYALGRILAWVWSYLELPTPNEHRRRITTLVVTLLCAAVAVGFLLRATAWQNSVRTLMEIEAVAGVRPLRVALVALAIFAALDFVGWQFRRAAAFLANRLRRVVPHRVAVLVGVVVAGALFWATGEGVIFALALRAVDGSYQQLDALIQDDVPQPDDPLKTGSQQSLITWRQLGKQGRLFVTSGPNAEQISAFHDAPALEPLRVYVGLGAAETPQERAHLALEELRRVGGFERSILLLLTPTGTGWVDPASLNPVEYLHRGNIASVAAQYSYLPSGLALLTEGAYGAEMARALFEEVYGYWTQLPKEQRPKLYLHGVSLGALNSDLSFDLYDVLRDPFHGVLWTGPPFRSPSWSQVTSDRHPTSPAWLPRFRDGSVVRFMNQRGAAEPNGRPWGPLRIFYLQYGSDPVTFFDVRSFYREPEWMRTPRAPDVAAELRWYPIVTFVQLAADMAAGAEAAPLGYGHNFLPAHYIDAWVALTEPDGWTPQHTRRLKALFSEYRRPR